MKSGRLNKHFTNLLNNVKKFFRNGARFRSNLARHCEQSEATELIKTKKWNNVTKTRAPRRFKPAHILLPLGVLVGLGLFAQKVASGFLNYFIKALAVSFDGFTPLLRVTVAVQNPSNQQFIIRSIVGNIFINETKAGNVSMFETITINPNTQTELPVVVRLDQIPAVSDLLVLIQRQSGNPQEIKLVALINANGLVNGITMTYKLTWANAC